ncbi:hypothetical protein O1611_g8743 [Lasiodiplodia mahajangana]|uniref:Uncharacterized protein n=1 Tax=Lasiodiplodia mahajangana TaxID=1108764 RepID=A0ACC2JBM3_9PEZI|nr:hypothetical protein O1611_g8743 [Lasiodiplodia mahajangana]
MMALPSELPSGPLRFTVPRSLQRFDLFCKFPYDIRHMIWEEVIFTPGIHFLKFVETIDAPAIQTHASVGTNSGGSLVTLPERGTVVPLDSKGLVYSATLKPIFPHTCADNSHYITMNKTLAQLRGSCNEAKSLVERVLAQPGNLTLDGGQLVLLQRSSDVVCIEYPNITHARFLGKWADHLDLDQLAKVRRLAIRYHHEWDNNLVCGYCGRVHAYHGRHPYPRHVYEFASLFKNLETFYFIDYLTVRKPPRSPRCPHEARGSGNPRERFASGEGSRTYFEVDSESCTTHTRVHETLSWLRNNYINHCMCKSRGPPRPETVRFKVLACEWDSDQKLAPTKRSGTQATPSKKRRTRSRTSDLRTSSQNVIISNDSLSQPTNVNILPVVFGDGGKSKFDFSLEVPH